MSKQPGQAMDKALGAVTPSGFSALHGGTRLDNRYTIQSVIAAGGFGITYVAKHDGLGRTYAIKEHFPRQFAFRDTTSAEVRATDPQTFSWALDRFLQEGRALAACKHPNVVDVTDIFEANGTAYMVLVHEDGQNLKTWLEGLGRGPTQAELDAIIDPLLDALGFVHEQGLLHRDIAPDNIMVRKDGTPCLIDFGAARQALTQRSQLMTGIVKTGFSPPDQYTTSGKAQGAWTDIYALGATVYRCVAGRVPPEATERQIHDALQPLAETVAAPELYRPSFLSGIDAALRLKQAERPQTVSGWRAMLAGIPSDNIEQLPDAAKAAAPPLTFTALPGSPRPIAPSPTSLLAVGLVAALATAGAGWWVIQNRLRPSAETSVSEAQRTAARLSRPITALAAASGQSARDLLTDGSVCGFCPELVVVPPGSFKLGSPASEPGRSVTEQQVVVTISQPFAVGRFSVTFDEWDSCVADGGCNRYRPDDRWGRGRRPVVNVNWDDSKSYAAWLSRKTGKAYRLLTETEREYVTRAGTTTPFWWGSSITPVQANYDGSAASYAGGGSKGEFRRQTVPVDSFSANAWGLHQVHGNIYEWTEDCWNDNTGNPGDGRARTTGECHRRVVRGGGWGSSPQFLRAASRDRFTSIYRNSDLGFRLARSLNP